MLRLVALLALLALRRPVCLRCLLARVLLRLLAMAVLRRLWQAWAVALLVALPLARLPACLLGICLLLPWLVVGTSNIFKQGPMKAA